MSFSSLIPINELKKFVALWLSEDCPSFDYGGYVVEGIEGTSSILCKSAGILCGKPFVDCIFEEVNCKVEWLFDEGELLNPICCVAKVTGQTKDLLLGERVALNVMSRASGIATICRKYNAIKTDQKWKGSVAGTRKTTPGFRLVEKYALLIGGCSIHRFDLSSMVMLKDNHWWSVGSITKCVEKARLACGFSTKIEVECRSVRQALEACKAGADVIMLDNFHQSIVHSSASEIKKEYPNVLIELSGGVIEDNIASYMFESVDIISTSTLTAGCPIVDFSMKIIKDGHDPANPLVT